MAKDNGSESAIHDPKHNIGEVNKIITECRDGMIAIRAARKDLNEQAAEYRERLKNAGVDTRVFDLNVRIYEMEQEVRDSYLDAFRLCYEAMNEGDQLDWIEAAPETEDTGPAASDDELNDLRENGRTAGKMGRSADTNPHSVDTDEGAAWHDGWLKGQKALTDAQFGEPQTAA